MLLTYQSDLLAKVGHFFCVPMLVVMTSILFPTAKVQEIPVICKFSLDIYDFLTVFA